MKNMNLSRHGTLSTSTKLLNLMKDGKPRTIEQAAREIAYTDAPVYAAAKKLSSTGELHICDWGSSTVKGRFYSIWSIGPGPDKPKPFCDEWEMPGYNDTWQKRIADELARPAFRHWMDVALFGEARA